ncbi:MAG: hypothetical protein AB1813_11425 [Verrucomicrobiota bacterium]|jgi:hypothetical protein
MKKTTAKKSKQAGSSKASKSTKTKSKKSGSKTATKKTTAKKEAAQQAPPATGTAAQQEAPASSSKPANQPKETSDVFISIDPKDPTRLLYRDQDGNNAYEAHSKEDKWLAWHCDDPSDFAIHFKNDNPFERNASTPDTYLASAGGEIRIKVKKGARPAAYSYSVAVFVNSGNPVVDDPQVIIN